MNPISVLIFILALVVGAISLYGSYVLFSNLQNKPELVKILMIIIASIFGLYGLAIIVLALYSIYDEFLKKIKLNL